jgi:predicted metal-dependent phosphotriesterase family hydrolase
MEHIQTLLGDIAPEEMGITDSHDHLTRSGGMELVHDTDCGCHNERSILNKKGGDL